MYIILYSAKRAAGATWLDKLISFVERVPYSHAEQLLEVWDNKTTAGVYGCHAARGGVSFGLVDLREYDVWYCPTAPGSMERFLGMVGRPYSYWSVLRTKLPWLPKIGRGVNCAHTIAEVLGMRDADTAGMKDLLDYIEAHGYRVDINLKRI